MGIPLLPPMLGPKNSTLFDEVTGGILSAEHTARGDVWQVIVTPTDGEDTATPITLSVSIANEAPVLNSDDVSISPFNASGSTDLSVVVTTASDADDDAIQFTHTWSVGATTLGSEKFFYIVGVKLRVRRHGESDRNAL